MPGTSTLDEYHTKRKELVDKDVSLRQDRAKYASMSDVERSAEEIVRRIRQEEALRVWSHEQDLFPGMSFLTGACSDICRDHTLKELTTHCLAARETIESTEIFKILKKVSNTWYMQRFLDRSLTARCRCPRERSFMLTSKLPWTPQRSSGLDSSTRTCAYGYLGPSPPPTYAASSRNLVLGPSPASGST